MRLMCLPWLRWSCLSRVRRTYETQVLTMVRLVPLPLVSPKLLPLVLCLYLKPVDAGAATSPVPAGVSEITTSAGQWG